MEEMLEKKVSLFWIAIKRTEKFIERDACKKGISFCVDFCSGCFKSALRNQNNYSIMDEEFNRINCSAVIRCRTTQRSG